jgi:hypothetical protein
MPFIHLPLLFARTPRSPEPVIVPAGRPELETQRLADRRLRDVSCGTSIACALTEDGEVYLWGYGVVHLPRLPTRVSSVPMTMVRAPACALARARSPPRLQLQHICSCGCGCGCCCSCIWLADPIRDPPRTATSAALLAPPPPPP